MTREPYLESLPIVNLLAVAILIALTAFFVMAEFAIVKIRSTQLEPHIDAGKKSALAAKTVVTHLDEYLSACQLGITITALGIGRLAEPTFEKMLQPIIGNFVMGDATVTTLSITVSFIIATVLHVVIGELAPKTIAIQKAEKVTLLVARPLIWFYWLLYPFIWLLNGSSRLLVRMLGFKPMANHESSHTEDELRTILLESYKSGEINKSEMVYVNNIFEFDDRVAKEIMVPRTEIIYLSKESSFKEQLDIILDGQYTRYPVIDGDKDNIIGLINLKEVFTGHFTDKTTDINQYIRTILHVSESTPIKKVLLKMQKERIHMAVVNDEYGGTAGLITVEDILEEIVGEIRDEFDEDETPDIQVIDEQTSIVSGRMSLKEINSIFDVNIEDDEVDTIGGWIFASHLDAQEGLTIEFEHHQFVVEKMIGYQIKKIKVIKPNTKETIEKES